MIGRSLVCGPRLVDIVPRLELRLIWLLAPRPRSCIPMATYEQSNFERIATAIGADVGQIAKHENLFEAAARWYRLDEKRPERTAPSTLRRKLDTISKSAHRLLKSLGVNDPNKAADGPGDPEIINALVLLGEPNEDPVIEGTRRIGRLVEIIGGVAATAEFERRAKKAATEVTRVGKLMVRLEDRIPRDHLLRRINPIVTGVLADLREKLASFYSDIGKRWTMGALRGHVRRRGRRDCSA